MSTAFELKPRLPNSFSRYVPRLPERDSSQIHVSYDERRRKALEEVDEARFSIFHVKACLVAGIGFFTCAYDIFAIGIAETMIGLVYGSNPPDYRGKLPYQQELALKVSTQVGIFFGQLLFGWLADAVGRKKMYGFELMIVILGTLAQACAGEGRAVNIIALLSVWRFVMGVGIGADYPLSAVITSEFSPKRVRGRMMTAVFAMQGFGNFAAALVALIVTKAFQSQLVGGTPDDPHRLVSIDRCWRLLIGLGAVPGCIALYCRLTIPETPRFTMDVERNVEQAVQDVNTFLTTGKYNVDPDAVIRRADAPKASWTNFKDYFGQWMNLKLLLGMAYAWFALDIPFYTLGLNSLGLLKPLHFRSKDCRDYNASQACGIMLEASKGNLILAAGGLIPGYWATFFVIDSWGRKPIQIMGFTVLTVIFLVMGAAWKPLHSGVGGGNALVFLYCIANFFQNFGPNTTTFIIPGEAFPTRYRATAHGICAAAGKLGAILSQVVFSVLNNRYNKDNDENCESSDPDQFVQYMIFVFAFFTLTGAAATLLIDETKGRTLEDISNERQNGFISGGAGPLELGSDLDADETIDSYQRIPAGVA
ncbi:Inorganic phosphate transporter pho84 [Ceratobasidium sp. 423]|nr:Inorganic phosphate transporter pho84 [Ceratobasidium sp. 423]